MLVGSRIELRLNAVESSNAMHPTNKSHDSFREQGGEDLALVSCMFAFHPQQLHILAKSRGECWNGSGWQLS